MEENPSRKRKREIQPEDEAFLNSPTVVGCGGTAKRSRRALMETNYSRMPLRKQNSTTSFKAPLNIWKQTIRKKVSSSIRRRKLKNLTDYSLPMNSPKIFHSFGDGILNCITEKPQNGLAGGHRPNSDHDLQQKIDHEIKMRDGTAKLLAASKHPAQMLEAAKNLLTSNTRIISYMTELQRRKTEEVMGKNSTSSAAGNQVPCKAKICLSDIRIPLMWKNTDHFKNKGDHRRYVVFCLLKIGTQIYDTSMVNNVDRSMTDITFDDVISFNNIPHDFECKIEIYCHKLHEDLTIASTPKKLRKKINDLSGSVGRSVGKRLSGLKDDADIIGNMVLGPRFELMATGSLNLADIDNCIRTYDLDLEPVSEAGSELPLFGHYCCKFAGQPNCLRESAGTGFLNLQANSEESLQEDDDLSKWKKYWCVLKNLELACWSSPTDVDVTQPLFTIPVTKLYCPSGIYQSGCLNRDKGTSLKLTHKNTQISDADPRTCKRSHTFHLKTVQGEFVSEHTLAAENKEDLNKWWEAFQQHLLDQVFWQHACEQITDLRETTPRKLPVFLRKSSLYEDTPINDRTSYNEEVIDNIQMDEKQLSLMLNTLMGEAKEIRGDTSSTASSSSTGT